MIPQSTIDKAKRIANRYVARFTHEATAAQFRFLVREIAFRLHDRMIAKYGNDDERKQLRTV